MDRLRTCLNRTALACAGAALLASGAVLASATDLVRDRVPSGWPHLPGDRVWLDEGDLGRWRDQGWWTPLVITALALGTLLFLAWATAQVRAGRLRELPLGHPGVVLSGPALAAVLTEQARGIDGVARAHVRLRGTSRHVRARVTLTLLPDAQPDTVLDRLARQTVAEARTALAPRPLTADVRLKVRSHKARRLR
ncbi:hypothetical protein [Streptomyces luteocolor]|uniref:hypothetical protein n=1 Tax=Streptomyces luteocolor TaxID=285500 RepID=UPI000853EAA8|nr:hypothetical protein [Streptomyces luteocolor]